MSSLPFKLSLIAVLSLGSSASALAQGVNPQDQAAYDARQQQYQQSQQDYQNAQDQYRSQQDQYWSQRNDAAARKDAYDSRKAQYDYDRDAYEQQRADYDAQYGSGAWERRYGYTVRDHSGYDYDRSSPCERRESSGAVAGGVIGALAGAAIGSGIAGRGNHTTGAVVGGIAGGAIGASVGASSAKCDTTGYYFGYGDTYPYRVSGEYRSDGRYGYDYYVGHHCRLAVAPANVDGSVDARYVRVCPDSYGRYRITP